MSLTPAATRAIEWLEQQIRDLASVRNATARDPVFRNWRQGTVTVLQRIWPGDQQRLERFRRIPFSPADPRADSRAIRESYSRGCQEAQRVLKAFIEDVREHGVLESAPTATNDSPDDFAGGIPTLQLGGASNAAPATPAPTPEAPTPTAKPVVAPAANAPKNGNAKPASRAAANTTPVAPASPSANTKPAAPATPTANAKPAVPAPSAVTPPVEPVVPASDVHGDMGDLPPQGVGESCPLPARKPRSKKPRLRELIDRAQESARAIVGVPRDEAPPPPVTPEPIVDRPSVVTSTRTTLRGNIDKVSLDSLISPEFRETPTEAIDPREPLETFATDETLPPHEVAPSSDLAPTPDAAPIPEPAVVNETPVAPEPIVPASAEPVTPSASVEDAEFAIDAAPTPAPPVVETPAAVLRLVAPLPPATPSAPADEAAPTAETTDDVMPDAEVEAFAEAAEAFLANSPVLGATAVPRPTVTNVREERLFVDPDAIAIASIVDDLHTLGIPESRHPETRARLMDLAQRLETADLEWHILRAAVWFAMEYPGLACRVVPVLLPRMDRAA